MTYGENDMLLPEGKTCSDCIRWESCKKFIGCLTGDEKECDWSPSHFWGKEVTKEATDGKS